MNLGSKDSEDRLRLVNDLYSRWDGVQTGSKIHDRLTLQWYPFGSPYLRTVYIKAAMETFRTNSNAFAYSFGAGVSFDDHDIKVLFSLL